jgi:hypothetical protein
VVTQYVENEFPDLAVHGVAPFIGDAARPNGALAAPDRHI